MKTGIQGAMQAPGVAPEAAAPVPSPAPTPAEAMPPVEPADGEVTPEEQELYNTFVAQSQMLIYEPETATAFIKLIKGNEAPIPEIGKFAAQVAYRVMMAAKEAGQEIDPEIILQGGAEIVEALIEINDEAGGPPIEGEDVNAVFYAAADAYRELMETGGQIDPAQAQADAQRLAEAEASGELAEYLPAVEPAESPATAAPPVAAPPAPERNV